MKRGEAGFTLIETIVAVVITGIITAAITQAMLIGLQTMDATNARIAGSNDTQLIAGYFNGDVASSEYVSTIGTRFHSAPATSASSPNSVLLSMFALARGTTTTAPNGMARQWEVASTGTDAATRVTVAAADDLVEQGAVTERVLESTDGTFSIDHSIVLAPASGSAITKGTVSTGATSGATSLTLARPATGPNGEPGAQPGDLLIAHVTVRGGTNTTATLPSGWTLLDSRDAGTTIKSLTYSHVASALDPLGGWTWTFNGTRESAGGIADYKGAGSVTAHTADVSPCGGNPPLLLLSWTDRSTSIANEVTYNFVQSGAEYTLVRKHCVGNKGVVVDQQTIARSLAAGTGATATCQPVACGPISDSRVIVTLTLTELPPPHESTGRVYQVRGSTRTTT